MGKFLERIEPDVDGSGVEVGDADPSQSLT